MKKIILLISVLFLFLNSFSQDSLAVISPYEVFFRNSTNKKLEVAIRYIPPGEEKWETKYWINLSSQEEKSVFFTKQKKFYYYARTNFVSNYGYDSWSGTAYYEKIGSYKVGMKLINIEKHKSSPNSKFILELK